MTRSADRFPLTLAQSLEVQGYGKMPEREQLEAIGDLTALHVSVCTHVADRLAHLARYAKRPFPAS